jgi:hypothetical protein
MPSLVVRALTVRTEGKLKGRRERKLKLKRKNKFKKLKRL